MFKHKREEYPLVFLNSPNPFRAILSKYSSPTSPILMEHFHLSLSTTSSQTNPLFLSPNSQQNLTFNPIFPFGFLQPYPKTSHPQHNYIPISIHLLFMDTQSGTFSQIIALSRTLLNLVSFVILFHSAIVFPI